LAVKCGPSKTVCLVVILCGSAVCVSGWGRRVRVRVWNELNVRVFEEWARFAKLACGD